MKTLQAYNSQFSLSGEYLSQSHATDGPVHIKSKRCNLDAALFWFNFGFDVMPAIPGAKRTSIPWDSWLAALSKEKITRHWRQNPDHDLGFIVGDDHIVLDADGPESIAALRALEAQHDVRPGLVVQTKRGAHHHLRLAPGTFARSDSHCTATHPARIDVKTGRALVMLPPSGGRLVDPSSAGGTLAHASDLTTVGQEFVDAVFAHNDRPPPRPPGPLGCIAAEQRTTALKLLRSALRCLDPDVGYAEWLRVGACVFHESGGSTDGFELFDSWSSGGKKYCGRGDTAKKWRSFRLDHPRPIRVGTLRRMVEAAGHDWSSVQAAAEPFPVIDANTEGER